MSFIQRLKDCNTHKESNFFKFFINNYHVGFIKKKNLNIINKFPEIFSIKANKIILKKEFNNFKKRTYAINRVFNFLVNKKIISSKHREHFKSSKISRPIFWFSIFWRAPKWFFKKK